MMQGKKEGGTNCRGEGEGGDKRGRQGFPNSRLFLRRKQQKRRNYKHFRVFSTRMTNLVGKTAIHLQLTFGGQLLFTRAGPPPEGTALGEGKRGGGGGFIRAQFSLN